MTSSYLPHSYGENCICYTGTHDNSPLALWRQEADPADIAFAKEYLGLNDEEGFNRGIIRGGMSSVAKLFVAQMQDYLELGAGQPHQRAGDSVRQLAVADAAGRADAGAGAAHPEADPHLRPIGLKSNGRDRADARSLFPWKEKDMIRVYEARRWEAARMAQLLGVWEASVRAPACSCRSRRSGASGAMCRRPWRVWTSADR